MIRIGRSKTSKYNACPTTYNGVRYDSKAEANRAAELDLLVRAGRVAWWLRQVPIDIGEPGVDKPYRVDFLVCEIRRWNFDVSIGCDCEIVHAEDVKGVDTASFKRHVRQWKKRGPFPLHCIRGRNTEIITRET